MVFLQANGRKEAVPEPMPPKKPSPIPVSNRHVNYDLKSPPSQSAPPPEKNLAGHVIDAAQGFWYNQICPLIGTPGFE